MTYYNPMLATTPGPDAPATEPPRPASPQAAADSTEMFAELNRALAAATTPVGGRIADVAAAFAPTDSSGSPLSVNIQRLCDWTYQCRLNLDFPNDAGYAAIARTVVAVL